MKTLVGPQIEAAAACWAMNHYRHYLIGRKFTLLTDQAVMKYMKQTTNPPRAIASAVLESMEFEYAVVHVPGPRHQAPDFMSRVAARQSDIDHTTLQQQERVYMTIQQHHSFNKVQPLPPKRPLDEPQIEFNTPPEPPSLLSRQDWETSQAADSHISQLRQDIEHVATPSQPSLPCSRFHVIHNGLVCFQRLPSAHPRVVVPESMRPLIFTMAHDKFGHRGAKSIVNYLATSFYWPRMSNFVRRAVRACLDCRRRKTTKPQAAGLTKSILTTRPGEVFFIDFIGSPLPPSCDGFVNCLVVIDGFTRYPFAIPLRDRKSKTIAENLITHIFSHTGLPICVHSDNEATLVSISLDLVFATMGVKRTSIAVRHPQGNSPAERFMRYLNESLSIVLPTYQDWPRMLPLVLFAYRTLPQATTGYSPFYMMYGRHPLLPLHASTVTPCSLEPDSRDTVKYVEQMIATMTDVYDLVRERQDLASRINASRRDMRENRFIVKFKPGDLVLLHEPNAASGTVSRARPIPPPTADHIPSKWKMKWSGPHRVISRTSGFNTYKIYHIFQRQTITINVDSLKLYHPFLEIPFSGLPQSRVPPPPPVQLPVQRGPLIPFSSDENTTPQRQLKGPEQAAELVQGDVFIALTPFIPYEPISVLVFLRFDPVQPDSIIAQWMGHAPPLISHFDRRMNHQKCERCWYQPRTNQHYWWPHREHKDHYEFTNVLTENPLSRKDVLIFNFHLRKDRTLPREVSNSILMKYRSLITAETTDATYEDPHYDPSSFKSIRLRVRHDLHHDAAPAHSFSARDDAMTLPKM
jgi:transposase InsO family protein